MIEDKLKNFYRQGKISASLLLNPLRSSPSYKEMATNFINNSHLSSETDYIVWVDTLSFRTNIFIGSIRNWNIVKSYPCTIGSNLTPTITGIFKVQDRGPYLGVEKGYKCLYYTQIEQHYLFHSIIYNLDGNINDDRMEMKLSDGCIRLLTAHAKWIYENVPRHSTIYIT